MPEDKPETPAAPEAPAAPVPTKPADLVRHPLGIPSGSVRGFLALSIIGTGFFHIAYRTVKEIDHLHWMSIMLVLGYYFAIRSRSESTKKSEKNPLYLPGGAIRFLIILGYLGTCGYLFYEYRNNLSTLFKLPAFLGAMSIGSFLVGRLVKLLFDKIKKRNLKKFNLFSDIKAIIGIICAISVIIMFGFDITDIPYADKVREFMIAYITLYFGSR